jgi:mRNA-degrading endonuclease RelE of RelBE toxin-antitoxin system
VTCPSQNNQPAWTVEFDDRARRELRKLDAETQQTILGYLRNALPARRPQAARQAAAHESGRPVALPGGDYRLICRFEENRWSFWCSRSATAATFTKTEPGSSAPAHSAPRRRARPPGFRR